MKQISPSATAWQRIQQPFLLLCVLLAGCTDKAESIEVRFQAPDGTTSPAIHAELATTNGERQLGLMYRREMGDNEGMLFIFPEESERSFWMKNTYLELDIVFMDKEQKVVSIAERAVPLSESPRPSKLPSKYVLEVKGGRARALGITPGSLMMAEDPLPPGR